MNNNQLPGDVQERIKSDAHKYLDELVRNLLNRSTQVDIYNSYIAGATAVQEKAQVLSDALEQFISYHQSGLLPAKHVYENAIVARQQWKQGKEVEVNAEIDRRNKLLEDDLKRQCRLNMPGISEQKQEAAWLAYKAKHNL